MESFGVIVRSFGYFFGVRTSLMYFFCKSFQALGISLFLFRLKRDIPGWHSLCSFTPGYCLLVLQAREGSAFCYCGANANCFPNVFLPAPVFTATLLSQACIRCAHLPRAIFFEPFRPGEKAGGCPKSNILYRIVMLSEVETSVSQSERFFDKLRMTIERYFLDSLFFMFGNKGYLFCQLFLYF